MQKKDKVVQIQGVNEAETKGDCDAEGPSVAVDPNLGGGPAIEVDPSTLITPTQTPVVTKETEQEKEMEAEGGWKVVARKTKDKGKQAMYASRMIDYSANQDPGRTGGSKGPNPYLS